MFTVAFSELDAAGCHLHEINCEKGPENGIEYEESTSTKATERLLPEHLIAPLYSAMGNMGKAAVPERQGSRG